MRIAALYDIHGNVVALEAVLKELSDEKVDAVVVGGDVSWGPQPGAVLDRLAELELPVTFIRGNADRELCDGFVAGEDVQASDITRWCAQQLDERQREWLGHLPLSVAFNVRGMGETLFCHATPRSDEEIVTAVTPESRFLDALSGARQAAVVCGHTHVQFDRTGGGRRLINAGSVGLPYEGRQGAYWALLGPSVQFRRTVYDIGEAVERMRASGCPHVEEVFIDTILHPPDRDETIRHFESLSNARSKAF